MRALLLTLLLLLPLQALAQVRISQFPAAVPPVLGSEIFWIDRDPFSPGSTRKATVTQIFGTPLNSARLLTDPGADRIGFWDDSANAFVWLTPGANLTITGTTLDATGGGGTPGGANTQLQLNNSGAFGGAASAAYTIATGLTTLDRLKVPYWTERNITNVTGNATFDLSGAPILRTTNAANQTITLANVPGSGHVAWLLRLSGNGVSTFTLVAPGGFALTPRWGTFASTPYNGLTEYYFEREGTTIYYDTVAPLSLADLPTAVQGDILYRDATAWARLAAGASGLFLKTLGAGANPIWDTPGGAGAGSGNMFNTGANTLSNVPRASDTSQTNYVPSLLLVDTNGSLTLGNDTLATLTNTYRVTGTDLVEIRNAGGINLLTAGFTGGSLSAAGAASGSATVGSTGFFIVSGKSRWGSSTNFYIELTGNAGTNFTGLRWGPTTNSIMWLKTNNTFMATVGNDELTLVPIVVSDVAIGSTGSVAGAISGKQDIDADLTAIAALAGTGLLTRIGAGSYVERSISPGSNMSVANGNGVAGNPTPGVVTSPTFTNVTSVASNPYGAGWDGSLLVPNENDLYDIISTLSGGGSGAPTNTLVSLSTPATDTGVWYASGTPGTNALASVGVKIVATTNLTVTGTITESANGIVSQPNFAMTGLWYSGGTATTTKPHFLIEPAGATSTSWDTGGTGFGVNAASGTTANLLDLQVNGTSYFKVSENGSTTTGGNLTIGNVALSTLFWSARSGITSVTDGLIRLVNNAGSGFTRLVLGVDDSAPDANVTLQAGSGVGTDIGGGGITLAAGTTTGNSVTRGNPKFNFSTFSTVSSGSANPLATALSFGGTLKVDTTTTGNFGSGEDDLISYTIPAAQLSKDGDYFEFDVFGTFAANANSAQVKFYWDGLAFFDSTSLIFNGLSWRGTGKIIRTSATTVKIQGDFGISGTLLGALTTTTRYYSADTSTLTGTIVFKVTGTDTGGVPADNKVVQEGFILKQYLGQ